MKFVMNGGIIIGTLDGANVEIYEEVGNDNIFIFGAKLDEIEKLRYLMCTHRFEEYAGQEIKDVFEAILSGQFGDPNEHLPLLDTIR